MKKSKYIDFKYFEKFHTDIFNKTIEDKVCSTFSDNIRDGYLNSKVNRFETMGRAVSYWKYSNKLVYGVFEGFKRKVNIKNMNLMKFINRHRGTSGYYSDLEMPVNEICRVIGVWRGKYPKKVFVPRFRETYYTKICLRRASEVLREIDDKYGIMVLPGTWRFNCKNLFEMATPNKTEYSYSQFMEAIRSRKDIDLVLPNIPDYNPDCINQVRVNASSFPGLNTSILVGKKRRITTRKTKPIAAEYAKNVIMAPRDRYVVDTSLYHVGGREKRVKGLYTEIKEVKTRITLSPEDVPTIIGQSVVVLINESLQRLAAGFNWGGRLNGRGQYLELVEGLDIKQSGGELINANTDFSGHDNHVNEKEMVFGMGMLRCCFPECDKIDRIFYYILSSLVCKRIVSPESNIIYEVWKGLPSGHTFTSILTTVTAYLKISTAIREVYNHDQSKINNTYLQGAGDDWVVKLYADSLSEVSGHINKYSGATCDNFNINAEDITADMENKRPTFLKKAFKNGLLAWNRFELFINFCYPTSPKFKISNYVADVTIHCVSGPFDDGLNTICKNLIIVRYMEELLFSTKHLVTTDYRLWGQDSDQLMRKIIDLAGINFMTPIDLKDVLFSDIKLHAFNNVLLETISPREHLEAYIADFDDRIGYSKTWMLARRIYQAFETAVRLKVFDTRKEYIYNESLYLTNFSLHKVYLSYKTQCS